MYGIVFLFEFVKNNHAVFLLTYEKSFYAN